MHLLKAEINSQLAPPTTSIGSRTGETGCGRNSLIFSAAVHTSPISHLITGPSVVDPPPAGQIDPSL
jgi:hypothetical protein